MDCNVAAKLAEDEIGAAIVPQDLAHKLVSQNKDVIILESQSTVSNNISVVHLEKRTMGQAAQQCYEWISEFLGSDVKPKNTLSMTYPEFTEHPVLDKSHFGKVL